LLFQARDNFFRIAFHALFRCAGNDQRHLAFDAGAGGELGLDFRGGSAQKFFVQLG